MIKTGSRPGGRWKCTPSAAFGGTSPRGGGLLSAYPCANLSCSLYSGKKTSPSGGSPRRGIGVHFHERSEVGWFSLPKAALPPKAAYILIAGRRYHHPLNPLNPGRRPGCLVFGAALGGYKLRRQPPPQPSAALPLSNLRTLRPEAGQS